MTLIRSLVGRAAVAVPFVGLTSSAFAQPTVGTLLEDLAAWAMSIHADIVVKAVIVGLIIASVVTWTVLLAKSLELSRAMREQRLAWRALDQARSLTEAAKQIGDGMARRP